MGLAVGMIDGDFDGNLVVLEEGVRVDGLADDGTALGDEDGSKVGAIVGRDEGISVIVWVGLADGTLLGLADGSLDGFTEGEDVVGAAVGK